MSASEDIVWHRCVAGCSLHRRRRTETPKMRQPDKVIRLEWSKNKRTKLHPIWLLCLLLSVFLSNTPCHSEGSSADKPLLSPPPPLKTKGCSFACGYVTSTAWAGTLYGVVNSHFSLAHDSCCLGSVAIQKNNNKGFFFFCTDHRVHWSLQAAMYDYLDLSCLVTACAAHQRKEKPAPSPVYITCYITHYIFLSSSSSSITASLQNVRADLPLESQGNRSSLVSELSAATGRLQEELGVLVDQKWQKCCSGRVFGWTERQESRPAGR